MDAAWSLRFQWLTAWWLESRYSFPSTNQITSFQLTSTTRHRTFNESVEVLPCNILRMAYLYSSAALMDFSTTTLCKTDVSIQVRTRFPPLSPKRPIGAESDPRHLRHKVTMYPPCYPAHHLPSNRFWTEWITLSARHPHGIA